MLLYNQEVSEVIKLEIKKYLKTNDNENTIIKNIGDMAKTVQRGIF